jgi:hypothetical protein
MHDGDSICVHIRMVCIIQDYFVYLAVIFCHNQFEVVYYKKN